MTVPTTDLNAMKEKIANESDLALLINFKGLQEKKMFIKSLNQEK